MDQYLDNRHKEILWSLLNNPADTGQLYETTLQRLVNDNPQSGVLQVLLARAGGNPDMKRAAAYFNTKTLYKLVHHPDSLAAVDAGKIVSTKTNLPYQAENFFSIPIAEEEADVIQEVEDREEPTTPETESISDEPETLVVSNNPQPESEPEQVGSGEESTTVSSEAETVVIEEKLAAGPQEQANAVGEFEQPVDEVEDITTENTFAIAEEPEPEPENAFTNLSADNGYRQEKEYFRQDIEDEIYDEIVGIEDIGITKPVAPAEPRADTPVQEPVWPETEEQGYTEETAHEAAPALDEETPVYADEEKLILGNIVSADYLAFDQKLDELRNSQAQKLVEAAFAPQPVNEKQDLSRYNDDKLPYSFMWWLDKTRKEHANSFQPYAETKPVEQTAPIAAPVSEPSGPVKPVKRVAPDELQQQYYENIFSLTSINGIDSDDSSGKVAFDHNKKEDIIIERFINTEPQIKPPAADKLDNENKAKRSSEDQDVLVTETLARIYTDQMLYHKAIATYKKLLLKFPEKKLYFAAQIEQLEKKTN